MTLRQYLNAHRSDDTPEGDLASDLLTDKQLKGKRLGKRMLTRYLSQYKFRNPEILTFLDSIWAAYRTQSSLSFARVESTTLDVGTSFD
jgi:hypothetical protein